MITFSACNDCNNKPGAKEYWNIVSPSEAGNTEQIQKFYSYPVDKQIDVYLFSKSGDCANDPRIEAYFTKDGKEKIPAILERIKKEPKVWAKSDLLWALVKINSDCRCIKSDAEIITSLEAVGKELNEDKTIQANYVYRDQFNQYLGLLKEQANKNTNANGAENLSMNAPQDNVKWTPIEYGGLLAGKSTYEDVKKLFGKPRWEGWNDEKAFESDTELEKLLQYSGDAKGKESIEVVTGEETKIVKAFSVRPYPSITKQEAITKFGPDYFEIGSGEPMCITGNKKGPSEKKLEFPMMLVYPSKGLYVLIDEDNKVNHFGFTYKCAD